MSTDILRQQLAEAASVYADASYYEARLRMTITETEAEIAASLLGQDNPATGKAHSATSAKEAAKETETVRRLKEDLLDAERRTIITRAAYECARIEAWASVAPAGVA